jgi:hypothetical protein
VTVESLVAATVSALGVGAARELGTLPESSALVPGKSEIHRYPHARRGAAAAHGQDPACRRG